MSSLVPHYFRYGPDIAGVKELQYSSFPYKVQPHPEKVATAKDAESLIKGVKNDSLKERVQLTRPNSYTVDQFFRVIAPQNAPKAKALKLWDNLRSRCQLLGIGTGLSALSLTVLALRHPPIYFTVALFVGTVVSCFFAGWSYQRYQVADHQVSVWRNPGEDFALRRKTALELPLNEIMKKKCFIGNSEGTLLGVEILHLFKLHFKQFAEPLLEKKCDQPKEKSKWISDFFISNPLLIDFFKENPSLDKEEGWTEILHVQQSLSHLQTFLDWKSQIPKQEQHAADVKKKFQDSFQSLITKVGKDMSLDAPQVADYQKKIFQALDEELFSKISTLIQEHKTQAAALDAQVYPDLRDLLDKFNKNVFEQKIFFLDFYKFRNLPDFQRDLEKLRDLFPQNVIEKAKSLSQDDPTYQRFVAEIFKP